MKNFSFDSEMIPVGISQLLGSSVELMSEVSFDHAGLTAGRVVVCDLRGVDGQEFHEQFSPANVLSACQQICTKLIDLSVRTDAPVCLSFRTHSRFGRSKYLGFFLSMIACSCVPTSLCCCSEVSVRYRCEVVGMLKFFRYHKVTVGMLSKCILLFASYARERFSIGMTHPHRKLFHFTRDVLFVRALSARFSERKTYNLVIMPVQVGEVLAIKCNIKS